MHRVIQMAEGVYDETLAAVYEEGWTRSWRFLIWTWTIKSSNDDWMVEMAQVRLLGYDEVHHYSRNLWLAMVSTLVVLTAVLICMFVYEAVLLVTGSGVGAPALSFMGFALLLTGIPAAVLGYFTFVPPREYSSSRKG